MAVLTPATNQEAIPGDSRPNPSKVLGIWADAEVPIRFGYDARQRFGDQNADWTYHIAELLRAEWEWGERGAQPGRSWDEVKGWVKYGYEYRSNG